MSQRSTQAKSFLKSKSGRFFNFKNLKIGSDRFQKTASVHTIILILLTFIFLFLAFKNIQYPLLWNDEGDTVVFGQQVLRYGYPKIHGDKNVIYHFIGALPDLAVKEFNDAYIAGNWGQYYFATPFILIADIFNNIYLKTLILRVPFTLSAIAGCLLFGVTFLPIFKNKGSKYLFLTLFLIFEIQSVFLLLEIRQVRYYPISILLSSLFFYYFIRENFIHKMKEEYYVLILTLLLFLIFLMFYPAYIVFVAFISIYALKINVLNKNNTHHKSVFARILSDKSVLSTIFSLFLVIPLFFYFEFPRVSLGLDGYYQPGIRGYLINLISITSFLVLFEFFFLAILLQTYLFIRKIYIKDVQPYRISKLLFLYIVVYIFVISKSPYMYSRYLVIFQPVIAANLALNIYIFLRAMKTKKQPGTVIKTFLLFVFVGGLLYRSQYLKGYFYEISHQYKGAIDYVIPYIQSKYEDPQDLVIATNYEEQVLMYYLNSKVIVGFAGKNIEDDLKLDPDIIIPRKNIKNFQEEIQYLIDKGNYKKTTFEIYDYPVNNISELFYMPRHLFKTKYASGDEDALEIYEKIK